MQDDHVSTVILVGHGAPPADAPREWVTRLKALEGRRSVSKEPPGAEELELDAKLRAWPRTRANDPYHAGITELAAALAARLAPRHLVLAFNEFCAPSLHEAVAAEIARGVREITVTTTMLTVGGVHAEVEIPETIEALRRAYPDVTISYAWPFDRDRIVSLFVEELA